MLEPTLNVWVLVELLEMPAPLTSEDVVGGDRIGLRVGRGA